MNPIAALKRHVVNFKSEGRPRLDDPTFYLNVEDNRTAIDKNTYPLITGTYEPRPYQWKNIIELHDRKRWCIWDEPGLGKTICAAYAAVRPVIVCVPLFLAEQWEDELRVMFPNDYVLNCTGTKLSKLERSELLVTGMNDDGTFNPLNRPDWYIINHEMLRPVQVCNQKPAGKGCPVFQEFGKCNHPKLIQRYRAKDNRTYAQFEYPLPPAMTLIIDEAHHFRGRTALMAKGAVELAKDTPHVFELTATPIYNTPDDLYMQLRIMHPLLFTQYWRFVDTYCQVDESQGFRSKIVGARNLSSLVKVMGRYGSKNTYAETGREIPAVIHNKPIVVQLSDTDRRKYDLLVNEYTELLDDGTTDPVFTAGSMIAKLNKVLGGSANKMDALKRRIEDVRFRVDGTDRGVLIATWHIETANKIAAMFDTKAITGEVAAEKRKGAAQAASLVVANMAALSEGVDLTHIHHVAFYEEYYVPGIQYGQFLKRVERERVKTPDDKDRVIVDYFHVADSLDEIKHESVTDREMNAQEIMARVVQKAGVSA